MTARPNGRRSTFVVTGFALVALYLAVVALTGVLGDYPVRPLFDGTINCSPYEWVNPPPEFVKGNKRPSRAAADVALASARTTPVALQSSEQDPQLVISLPPGGVPPHPPDGSLHVVLTPLDANQMAPLPTGAGLRADGNVYRVEMSYQPSGLPVSSLASPGDVSLVVPEPAQRIAVSSDGASWQLVDAAPVPNRCAVAALFRQPGYYVAATSLVPRTRPPGSGGGSGTVLAVVGVGLLAVVLVGTPLMVRRARRRPR